MSSRALRSQRRAAHKRAVLGAIDENIGNSGGKSSAGGGGGGKGQSSTSAKKRAPLDDFDGSNEAHVLALIADIEEEMGRRKSQLDSDCEAACMQLATVKRCAMLKLPKVVRKMTVGQFREQYGCDLMGMCGDHMESVTLKSQAGGSRVLDGKADEYGRPLRTPARVGGGASVLGRTPATVRAARRGEVVYSANGSPVEVEKRDDVVFSVKKPNRNAGDGAASSSSVLSVNVGEDRVVVLKNRDDIEALDPAEQKEAYEQLKAFHAEVTGLMTKFPLGSNP